jgi:hypothetical protein
MPFQLRHIDDLAEELGSAAKAKSALVSADVRVINGFYDHGALEAVFAEPKATNVGRAKKNLFTLSETDGIGAIKHCLDKVDLDIVRHLYHGTNFITARNAKGKRRRMKVYSASRTRTQWQIAYFQCTGFLDHRNPGYYLFVCYEGPIAWAMSRNDLIAMHKKGSPSRSRSCRTRRARCGARSRRPTRRTSSPPRGSWGCEGWP